MNRATRTFAYASLAIFLIVGFAAHSASAQSFTLASSSIPAGGTTLADWSLGPAANVFIEYAGSGVSSCQSSISASSTQLSTTPSCTGTYYTGYACNITASQGQPYGSKDVGAQPFPAGTYTYCGYSQATPTSSTFSLIDSQTLTVSSGCTGGSCFTATENPTLIGNLYDNIEVSAPPGSTTYGAVEQTQGTSCTSQYPSGSSAIPPACSASSTLPCATDWGYSSSGSPFQAALPSSMVDVPGTYNICLYYKDSSGNWDLFSTPLALTFVSAGTPYAQTYTVGTPTMSGSTEQVSITPSAPLGYMEIEAATGAPCEVPISVTNCKGSWPSSSTACYVGQIYSPSSGSNYNLGLTGQPTASTVLCVYDSQGGTGVSPPFTSLSGSSYPTCSSDPSCQTGSAYYCTAGTTCDSGSSSPPSSCSSGESVCASSGSSSGAGATLSPIANAICGVYYTLNDIIFILALAIMILGGALYGGATVLPAQQRGQVQGYAMGMIMGGIIGVIIAVLSPYILSVVTNTPQTQILSVCS